MKYIKTFENLKEEPSVGDYIILDKYDFSGLISPDNTLYIWKTFLTNTIGKIKQIYYSMSNDKQITIAYNTEDVPRELKNTYLDLKNGKYQRTFHYDNIKNFFTCSNNIDDLKSIIDQNKYNL